MRFGIEKVLIFIMIIAIVILAAFVFYLLAGKISKSITVTFPAGGEELRVGETYKITWKSRGISKVGIILYKDENPKWLAEDIDASSGEYEWKIYPGQDYGDNFWIAVVEYPWQKNKATAYTDGSFAIVYPTANSCDSISAQKQWVFIPSDYPGIRKVFITETSFTGNLGGLEGADKKCQEEAKNQGYSGVYRAFLGGDSDNELAVERVRKTARQTKGVFVYAKPEMRLANGISCNALLGNNFNDFLANFSNLAVINKEKFDSGFFQSFSNVWLGRIDNKSKNTCVQIFDSGSEQNISEQYSFTTTCQRWTNSSQFVSGYPVPEGQAKPAFPNCYTPSGTVTNAVALAGLSVSLQNGDSEDKAIFTPYQAKNCDSYQKLICIED